MNLVVNTDLFIVGLAITGIAILGFLIYFNNKSSTTNKAFLLLSIFTILYNGFNYLTYKFLDPNVVIWLLRTTIFLAVWHSFFTFHLLYVFPEKKKMIPKFYKFFLLPFVITIAILTLTPLIFKEVMEFNGVRVSRVINGPFIFLFVMTAVGLNLSGVIVFILKILRSPKLQRRSLSFVLIGFFLTIFLILIFSLILPTFFGNSNFVTFGAAFSLPFLFFTYYAIVRHKLMNIKVVSTEFLVIGLSVAVLFEVITSNDLVTIFYKGSLFLLILSVGILLIQSVRKEVQQNEKLLHLAKSLETANLRLQELDRQKTEFLSILR